MRSVRSIAVAIIAGLTVAVGAAACGGGSKPAATGSTSAATTTTSASVPAATTATTTTTATQPAHKASKPKKKKPATSPSPTTTHATTTASHPVAQPKHKTTHKSPPAKKKTPQPAVLVRPMHVTFVGQNHAPIINRPWTYTVTATDAKGHPLSGTVDTEFAFNGSVVGHETPPTHRLTGGRLTDTVTFPPQSKGFPIDVQVVVHTSLGTVTLDWAVKPRS
ncbi:MAG TPA: hypothetical protein VE992_05010 [Solirubrobacteraceae bacterium]|nr:hypothetical protein [Solirubrobacteraceae bacterium]